MDVRQLTRLIGIAAQGSLILLGSTAALAGHYSYEQPTRPHVSAADAPNWGFNQTCWSRFPPVPGCVRTGYDFRPEGDANQPSQQLLYAPQNALLRLDSQIVTPKYGNSQAPANVFPTTPPQTELEGMPAMPIPNVPSTLPPQPAPGLPALGHSSLQMPNIMQGTNRQLIARPVSASTTPMPHSSRYGSVGRSVLPATTVAQVSAVSFTNTVLADTPFLQVASPAGSRYGHARSSQQLNAAPQISAAPQNPALNSSPQGPLVQATQSRDLSSAARTLSYRSGNAKPSVRGIAGPQLQPAELPAIVIYPTISGKPLYRTP